jgi:putative transposase
MEVSEAQEVKQLREENARLRKLVADLSLDKDMLQSVIRKNSLVSYKDGEVQRLRAEFTTSERHICELMSIARSGCRYRSRRDDSVLRQQFVELAHEKPCFGTGELTFCCGEPGQRSGMRLR